MFITFKTSVGNRWASKVSLQLLRLQRRLSERLSEEVLGPVSSSVAAVTCDWQHHLLVLLVLYEYLFEAITQVEEVIVLRNLALQYFWSHVEVIETGAHLLLQRVQTNPAVLRSGCS